jgi:hypothetical protein
MPQRVAENVFVTSAGLCGMCLTGVGLLQVPLALQATASVADDLLVVNALLYMVACILAYARMRAFDRTARLPRFIDVLLLGALAMSIGIGAFIAWTLVP